jgi:hypothetical protein
MKIVYDNEGNVIGKIRSNHGCLTLIGIIMLLGTIVWIVEGLWSWIVHLF